MGCMLSIKCCIKLPNPLNIPVLSSSCTHTWLPSCLLWQSNIPQLFFAWRGLQGSSKESIPSSALPRSRTRQESSPLSSCCSLILALLTPPLTHDQHRSPHGVTICMGLYSANRWLLVPTQCQYEFSLSGTVKKETSFSANSSVVIQHSCGAAQSHYRSFMKHRQQHSCEMALRRSGPALRQSAPPPGWCVDPCSALLWKQPLVERESVLSSSQRGADIYGEVPASIPWLVSSHADEDSKSSQFYWSKKHSSNWSEWSSSDCSVKILMGLWFDRKNLCFGWNTIPGTLYRGWLR